MISTVSGRFGSRRSGRLPQEMTMGISTTTSRAGRLMADPTAITAGLPCRFIRRAEAPGRSRFVHQDGDSLRHTRRARKASNAR